MMAIDLSEAEFRYVINNVFLPPYLPHNGDGLNNDSTLLKVTIKCLSMFDSHVHLDQVKSAIKIMQDLHDNYTYHPDPLLLEEGLLTSLKSVSQNG